MMFKKKIKFIFILIGLLAVVFSFSPVLAQTDANNLLFGGTESSIRDTLDLGSGDPRVLAANVIRILLGFLGIIAVVIIMYAGWLWMTANGESQQIDKAKKTLIGALIGLVIILSSFAIASFVMNSFLNATGGGAGTTDPGGGTIPGGGGPGGGGPGGGGDPTAGFGDPCDDGATCSSGNPLCAAGLICDAAASCTCQGSPIIEWVSPVDASNTPNGAPGNLITIGGRFFGGTAGEVYFWDGSDFTIAAAFPNSVNVNCTNNWTDNQIIVVVPAGAIDGPIKIVRSDGDEDTTDNAAGPLLNDFDVNTISKPGLCLTNPDQGYINDSFNLQGINYSGTEKNVLFGNSTLSIAANSISGWSDTSVNAAVPNLVAGLTTVFVEVDDQSSNSLYFKIFVDSGSNPIIDYVDPAQGPIGQYITIYGQNFGQYNLGDSYVRFYDGVGYVDADISFPSACQGRWWYNDHIVVKVPATSTGFKDIVVTRKDGAVSPPHQFNVTSGVPGPGLCLIQPHNGPVGQSVIAYGDNFGNTQGAGRAEYYSVQEGLVSNWTNQQVDNNVPTGAVTGPFKVISNSGDVSNSLQFSVGACASSSDCDISEECCGSGTYWEGICRLPGSCNSGAAAICSYTWSFSTAAASTAALTCGGFATAQACLASGSCPNSPGQCQTSTNPVVGTCDDDFCNNNYAQCGNSCTYNVSLDKCVNNTTCDSTHLFAGYTSECKTVNGSNVWQFNTGGASCPAGSYLTPGGWCTEGTPTSPASCSLCANGFDCVEGVCATVGDVCPGDSVCTGGQCIAEDNCECCCRVGDNPATGQSYSLQDCCAGLTCQAGSCGGDPVNYGLCAGCRVEVGGAFSQSASDAACNCSGGGTRYCDISGDPTGVCKDRKPCDTNPYNATCDPSAAMCSGNEYCDTDCFCKPGLACDGNLTNSVCDPDSAMCDNAAFTQVCDDDACVCKPQYCSSDLNACVPDDGMCNPSDFCNPSNCICYPGAGGGAAAPGEFCFDPTIAACSLSPAACLTDYQCLSNSSPDCRCCCTPGTTNAAGLECSPDISPCSGGDRGLFCGCTDDNQCGNTALGACGNDTCCHGRPQVIGVGPIGIDVCRNTLVSVEFNQRMNTGSFNGNVVVVGDYGTGQCPAGTQYLTKAESKGLLQIIKKWITKLPFINKIINQANAITGNFCAIEGRVSGYNLGASSFLSFSPTNVLDANRTYYVIILGDSNVNDNVNEGVLNEFGLSMGASIENFNGINYSGVIWQFTTKPIIPGLVCSDNTGSCPGAAGSPCSDGSGTCQMGEIDSGICELKSITVDPASYLFQQSGMTQNFMAYALDGQGNKIVPTPGVYDWTWNWSSDNVGVITIGGSTSALEAVTSQDKSDGQTFVNAIATTVPGGQKIIGKARVYTFFCENPWPAATGGAWSPWIDNSGNCNVNPGSCPNTNYEFYYCRDSGGAGTADDLPAILSDNAVVVGSTGNDPLKLFYFHREDTPLAFALVCSDLTGGCAGLKADDTCSDASGKCTSLILNNADLGIGKRVSATWPAVSGADGYKLYYGKQKGKYNDFVQVTGGATTSAIVNNLDNGSTYFFAVTAYYNTGAESFYSNEVSIIPTDGTDPAIPAGLTAVAGNAQIELTWNSNADDTIGYKLYYGTSAGSYGSSQDVDDATGATVTGLTNGVTYYFAVTAYDKYGNESVYSVPVNSIPSP